MRAFLVEDSEDIPVRQDDETPDGLDREEKPTRGERRAPRPKRGKKERRR